MKTLIFLLFIVFANTVFAQDVTELPFRPLDNDFVELANKLVAIDKTDDSGSIKLAKKALAKTKDNYIKHDLIYWELAYHYANTKQYEKCMEVLKNGQEEGLFYFTRSGKHPFPQYLSEIEKLKDYTKFEKQNSKLKEKAASEKSMEYMIQLPKNYNKDKKYPLLLIMHGGIGSIQDLQYYYASPKLGQDFIVAFFQGGLAEGSYVRSFKREGWQKNIKAGFKQIIDKYPVDTNKVVLAGPSAGGYKSLELGLKGILPAKGLLVSFGVAPKNMDSTDYIKAARQGLKVALLCGEHDWAIKQQKGLAYKLDKYGVKNRFVIFPDKGHEFPNNWPHHMDTSLEFILDDN